MQDLRMNKEVTLSDILSCMWEQKEENNAEKKVTNEKMENFMEIIGENVKEMKRDIVEMNSAMRKNEGILRETNDRVIRNEKILMERLKEQEKTAKEMKANSDLRMSRLEESLKGISVIRHQSDNVKENQTGKEDRRSFLPRANGEGRSETEPEKEKGKKVTSWKEKANKQLEEDAKKMETEKAKEKQEEYRRRTNEERKKFKSMKALRKWFCAESDGSEVSAVSSSDEEENWEQKINRQERNKLRRKRNKENKIRVEKETLKKASQIMGLQPIMQEEIDPSSEENEI